MQVLRAAPSETTEEFMARICSKTTWPHLSELASKIIGKKIVFFEEARSATGSTYGYATTITGIELSEHQTSLHLAIGGMLWLPGNGSIENLAAFSTGRGPKEARIVELEIEID